MRIKISIALALLLVVAAAAEHSPALAGGAAIKNRMKARLPIIADLKGKGIVGENNQGLLEFRGARQRADVVEAENQDRRTVYAAIAKQQKVSAAKVGQRRALRIAQSARSGEWLQNAQGQWHRK